MKATNINFFFQFPYASVLHIIKNQTEYDVVRKEMNQHHIFAERSRQFHRSNGQKYPQNFITKVRVWNKEASKNHPRHAKIKNATGKICVKMRDYLSKLVDEGRLGTNVEGLGTNSQVAGGEALPLGDFLSLFQILFHLSM